MKEEFFGNLYLFFSCSASDISKILEINNDKCTKISDYLDKFESQINLEITSTTSSLIKRKYVDELNFFYLDENESIESNKTEIGKLFATFDTITNLVVVTVAFFETRIPISHILDRLSQNNIQIFKDDKKMLLSDYLQNMYCLEYHGSAKACLTTNNSINDEIYPYYIANETFDSSVMSATLKDEIYGKKLLENLAQYNSSDIYSGKNTIIRIDKRDYKKQNKSRIESDIIFLFIIEILMFKETAIERSNKKIINYLNSKKDIDLKILDKLNREFSQTIPFWDIKVFKYIAAQNLANKIESSFGLNERYENYEKNQNFLQHKINIKQAIAQEHESKILFTIAIVLFIFEVYKLGSEFIGKSTSLFFSTSLFLIFLIYWINKNRKLNDG